MTSRHNETLLARRAALKARNQAELDAVRKRQAKRAAQLTAVDRALKRAREAQLRAAGELAAALPYFSSPEELAGLVGLPTKDVQNALKEYREHLAAKASAAPVPAPANERAPGTAPTELAAAGNL